MAWYAWILLGVIIGMVGMYLLMKPNFGNKYTIDADIKNKKGQMTDNIFKGEINEKQPKKGFIKRILTKKRNA